MKRRLYPAVLERGPKGTFGAWFPDFLGCVAAGRSQEDTIERAERVSQAMFDAGAGVIGNYTSCSFRSPGIAHPTKRMLRFSVPRNAVVDDVKIYNKS